MNTMGEPGILSITQRNLSMDTLDTQERERERETERELSMNTHKNNAIVKHEMSIVFVVQVHCSCLLHLSPFL